MGDSNILFTDTLLGLMWLWATEKGVCGVGFGDSVDPAQFRRMERLGIEPPAPIRTPLLVQARARLLAYYDRREEPFDLPLDLRGTEFQHRVWEWLKAIPYGETTSYGAIATLMGIPNGSQAVGQAVGANPVVIFVPCHRVVGYAGALVGYGGGLERKAALLELEQAGLQLRLQLRLPLD